MNLEHLHPRARDYALLSEVERIDRARQPFWLPYPRAESILKRLDELRTWPKRSRMPNVLITGPSNNGKTTILRHFLKKHTPSENLDGDSASIPVLMILTPPGPDETALYDAILANYSTPISTRDLARDKRFQVISLARRTELKLLLIDEIQDLFAGDTRKHRQCLVAIKYLSNALQIPIVASGVESAVRALQLEEQTGNRFEVISLPRWKYDSDFQRLLANFEAVLPLRRPSNLSSNIIAEKIHYMTEGAIGEVSSLLAKALEKSLFMGRESVDLEILGGVEWIKPSDRRRSATHL